MRFFTALLTTILLAVSASAQLIPPGYFSINGFSGQELVFHDFIAEQSFSAGDLGTTANLLRLKDSYLFVVHSGDYTTGEGVQLWYDDVIDVVFSAWDGYNPNWSVLELPDWSNAWDVYYEENVVWISLTGSNSVRAYGLSTGDLLGELTELNAPEGLCTAGEYLAVAESGFGNGNQVSIFTKFGIAVIAQVEVGTNPQYMVEHDNFLYVLCSGRSWGDVVPGEICKINLEDYSVESFPLEGNPGEIALFASDVPEYTSKLILGDEYAFGSPNVYSLTVPGVEDDPQLPDSLTGGYSICIAGEDILIGSSLSNSVVKYSHDWSTYTFLDTHDTPVADLVYYPGTAPVEDDPADHPATISLAHAWPNPFNATTRVSYTLDQAGHTSLKLYNLSGQLVRTLTDQQKSAGTHSLTFSGNHLPSGCYFLRLESGSFTATQRLVMVK